MVRLHSLLALLTVTFCTLGLGAAAHAAPAAPGGTGIGERTVVAQHQTNANRFADAPLYAAPDWSLVMRQAVTTTTPLTPSVPVTNSAVLTEPITLPPITEPPTQTTPPEETVRQEVDDAPAPAQPAPSETPLQTQLDAIYNTPLEGTIIANRTSASVTFFVEGELYRLAPLRSFGVNLPRSTGVLNLYNCAADTPQTEEGCFWDPYLIQAEGFYEIFNTEAEGEPLRLVLEEAGTPPTDQVWIQNRTGQAEVIIYNDTTVELAPSAVHEFEVGEAPIVTFYRRSCLSMNGETVCEWSPQSVEPGFYYALDEVSSAGAPPNSQISVVDLQPVLAREGEIPLATAASGIEATAPDTGTQESSTASAAPGAAATCQLQIPVLNVRSGPGLEYLVISQLTADGLDGGNVAVVGRDAAQQWLAVDESIAPGGWVAAGPQFLQCDRDIAQLPVAEITDGRLAPTPTPAAAEPATDTAEGESAEEDTAASAEATEEAEDPAVEVPTGQAVLVVTNAFDQEIRFTLAPDEYDLPPGETIYVVVNPGRVQFSVSSPWRGGISGNAEFVIEPDQSATLFLYFVPDPSDSGEWELRYE